MEEDYSYPTMKEAALELYDKIFVLDYAPLCYSKCTNKEDFLKELKKTKEQVVINDLQIELLSEYTIIQKLKTEIIDLRNGILLAAKASDYEKMADLRIAQKALVEEIGNKKISLKAKSSYLIDEKNNDLLHLLLTEIEGFLSYLE